MLQFKAVKFISTSMINTIVGVSIIVILQQYIGTSPSVANMIGFGTGYIVSYLLNRNWTFKFTGSYSKSMGLFVVASVGAYLINLLCLNIMLIFHVTPLLAQMLAVGVHGLVHFLLMQFFVFKPEHI